MEIGPLSKSEDTVKQITRLLESCNRSVNGSRTLPSNLGALLTLDCILIGAVDKDLIGVICCFPLTTEMGVYGCVTFFCVEPGHRKTGLASRLKRELVAQCRRQGVSFSYQITPKCLFDSSIKIRNWYRPINAEIVKEAGFDLGFMNYRKLVDNSIDIVPATEEDRALLDIASWKRFRWTPDKRQFSNWLKACPTYVVKRDKRVLIGMFSLFPLRIEMNGVELRVDHLAWFAGVPGDILTAAITKSNADLVIGYLTGGLTPDIIELNIGHISSLDSWLSLYGVKRNLSPDDISVPLL